VSAAIPSLSARIEQPKSPTRFNNLDITVVTLDREGRDITVKCFKKGPSEGGFSQFGADIAVTAGGNSVHCETNSSVMPNDGTYLFYAEAYAGSDTSTTATVSVDYNTSGPGTPTNYSKEKPSACTYKIKFKTADDSGNTTKVRIYRSENTTFDLNAGSLIATVNIGSNTEGEHTDTIPVCDKTYYYALRAFDSAENGSGVVGDSEIRTTTSGTGTSGSVAGASSGAAGGAIAAGTAGNVLGQDSGSDSASTGDVMGDATPSSEETYDGGSQKGPSKLAWGIGIGILGLLVLAWLLRKKNNA
jgi:hypothetical protein